MTWDSAQAITQTIQEYSLDYIHTIDSLEEIDEGRRILISNYLSDESLEQPIDYILYQDKYLMIEEVGKGKYPTYTIL